jgi:hypothetical protein
VILANFKTTSQRHNKLTSRSVYELWDYNSPNSIFSIDEVDWIYEQSVFENGKIISQRMDFDPEKETTSNK